MHRSFDRRSHKGSNRRGEHAAGRFDAPLRCFIKLSVLEVCVSFFLIQRAKG